jgi:putative membrane-bound dehydrogenase-like protein
MILRKTLSPWALALLMVLATASPGFTASSGKPLRVFIRASEKTHGPGTHDYPQFLRDWTALLQSRGAVATGAMRFPTADELKRTDVLVLYAADGANVAPADRRVLEAYQRGGGGLVVLHDGICGEDPAWFKTVAGGAKKHGSTNWQTGRLGLYFGGARHPITEGVSNFDLDDESFFQIDLAPEAQVLATTFRTAKEIVPQMWVYQKRRARAFVSVQGHRSATFDLPHYRALLLRGIAWAGRREVDALTRPEELSQLRYPEGGPTAPDKAAGKLQLSSEFSLSLVASEPMVVKPISLDWDARGRMWVAVTPEYPFKAGKGRSRDALLVLEDRDGDQRMDSSRVFADNLILPTSFVFWRDGVIVAQAPEILYLRDRNGDGRADRREILFSGFGTMDTHAVINNLRWGLDGWIYGCQGYSGNDSTNVVNARGRKFGKIGNGIFRFRPDGSAMEQVSSYAGNSWGIDFSDEGELFFSKANGPHINHVVMPERYLAMGNIGKTVSEKSIEDHSMVNPIFTDARHEYVQVAPVGVFTAASGCTIYQGGIWPEKYHGSHFVCEPTVHIVHEDIINRSESPTFEATRRDTDEFIAGNDLWFRPIHTRVGPDGQMYLLDFYNQAISHNDIRGIDHGPGNAAVRPDRDHQHGRIYRISHKQQRRLPAFQLDPASPGQLVQSLQHPNMWVRMTAQRLLTERQDLSVVPALTDLLRTNRFVHVRLHALWTLHHLNALAETNLLASLKDEHPSVLNNALRAVAELRMPPSSNVTAAVIKLVRGSTERTRLEALFALASFPPSSETVTAVHKLYPDLKDGWAKSSVLGIARQAPTNFIRASFGSDKADSYIELVQILIEDFVSRKNTSAAEWVLRYTARQAKASSKLRVAVLDIFNKHLEDFRLPFTTNLDLAIGAFLDTDSKSTRIATFPLAMHYQARGTYGTELAKVRRSLFADLANPKAKDEDRNALLTSLIKVPILQKDVIGRIESILAEGAPEAVQKHMVTEMGTLRDPMVAEVLLKHYTKFKGEARLLAFAQIIRRPEWAEQLITAVENNQIKLSELTVYGASRLRTHPDAKVARRATAVLDVIEGPRKREKDQLVTTFEAALKEPANIDNGRDVLLRNCTICHKFNDKGRALGPEITGIGVHGASVLLTHILDPNRVVEANFIAYNLTTKKGDDYSGLIKTENKESVTLKNLEGEVTVKRADIESLTSSGLSLMPEGMEALGEKNIRDLIGYIMARSPTGYRSIDLTSAFTTDTLQGVYQSREESPSFVFKQLGVVMVDSIPFTIANPAATSGGRNLVVLKGGEGYAKTLPKRVEFKVDLAAKKFYVLGGVAGWGFPYGPPEGHNVPAVKATLFYEDGQKEEIIWKNGVEFADYARPHEVPGSKPAASVTNTGQLRWFSFQPARSAKIARIALESFDNHMAPTFVAVTAEVK